MEQVTMMERARGFKEVWDTVEEQMREHISPEAVADEQLLTVSVITEWVDPLTGNKRLIDHHISFGGEHMAAPWTAKGNMVEAFQQYDRNRGRE